MRRAPFTLLIALMPLLANGQSNGPRFEVASVKPLGEGRGGGVSSDPERITYESTTLEILIQGAFGIQPYQISGPSWIQEERYAVTAKVPPGTTTEQRRQMMANLLAERFGLVYHREMKDFPGYTIVVAKGGPKLKSTTHDDQVSQIRSATDSGITHWELTQTSTALLTNRISMMLNSTGPGTRGGVPVVDRTEITEKYDFMLDIPVRRFPQTTEDAAINISDALQRQAGLRLEPMKVPLPMLIVDHADRVPTEN